ncbi:MAG: helix-turn-helix domain-containing protein [Clostridia bacterium]|nr:helix-turn-helix domain-containing protein [Clostridia bacterium]
MMIVTNIGDLSIRTVIDGALEGAFAGGAASPVVHSHAYYELLLSMDGTMVVELDEGERILLPRDSLCLLPPNHYHRTKDVENSSQLLGIRFSFQQGERKTQPLLYERLLRHTSVMVFAPQPRLCGLMRKIAEEIFSEELGAMACVEALLTQFYVYLLRLWLGELEQKSWALSQMDEKNSRKLLIEDYFHRYYADPISEEHLATQLNLSKRQVNRVLQEIYGKSFRSLLIEVRLRHAAQLLCESDRSVEEIAWAIGYTSLSGFYSAFSRQFGVSAGKYRRQWAKK